MSGNDKDWTGGQLLAFSALDGVAPYKDGLVARTALAGCGLDIMYPAPARILFRQFQMSDCLFESDVFVLGKSEVRGVFADAWNLLIEGTCTCELTDNRLEVQVANGRTLLAVRGYLRPAYLQADFSALWSARAAWLQTLQIPQNLPHPLHALMRKVASVMKTQVYSSEGRIRHRWSTPDRFPHRQMWLWDSVFHAIGWRHLDPALARDLISAVFDCQGEDGFIPHMMTPEGQSDITQPPVLAYGIRLVESVEPNLEWIRDLYQPLIRYLAWNRANRDSDGAGLLEWHIEGDPRCRSGESGMDNSSRFDAATRMDAVDFNCFMAKEYECLAEFAKRLGLPDDARRWQTECDSFRDAINSRLWNEEEGLYYDYDVEQNTFCSVAAVSGFLPIFCGAATPERLKRLLARLQDPDDFGTALPLPSVSRKDPTFDYDMWRGPAWMNMSWLVAEGLVDYGYPQLAENIRQAWLGCINKYYLQHGCIFEYYDALDERSPVQLPRKGKVGEFPHQVIRDYGWSATLCMDWCWRSYR